MCFKSLSSRRRTRMNTEGLPVQALKRKKTRRLKKRKPQDYENTDFVETPVKKMRKQTAAPENTTQFLMDDREKFETFNFLSNSPTSTCSSSNSTSSVRESPVEDKEFEYCSDNEENFDQLYFEKDFNAVYDNIHAETLFALTKQELISRYLDLEKREEELLKKVNSVCCSESCEMSFKTRQCKEISNTSEERTWPANKQGDKKDGSVSHLQEIRHVNPQIIQENERLRGC